MPLHLDKRAINRFSDRAMHRQLADAIRAAIERGDLRPGESLPSEGELVSMVELSRTPVRAALDLLVNEGRVTKRTGAPSRVAEQPVVRHMSTSRYQAELDLLRAGGQHPPASAFTIDHDVEWDRHTVTANYSRGNATRLEAPRLGLKTGAAVLRRQLIKYVDQIPRQLQRSVLPWSLVADTPIVDPELQPWPGGTIAELYSVGLPVSRVVEEAQARVATDDERCALHLDPPGMVLAVDREFWSDDQVVELSVAVVSAASTVLRYETDLT